MSLIERKELKYILGSIGAASVLYGIYRAYLYFFKVPPKQAPQTKETHDQEDPLSNDESQLYIPYSQMIGDLQSSQLSPGQITEFPNLKDINYSIILCLIKGSGYQGIVNISLHLESLRGIDILDINFRGIGIKYLKVNGKKIEPREVRYQQHKISIPANLLKEKAKNTVQIIFQNDYSFLGNGMAAYFLIDDHNKYSLRQQVIYSVSGWNQIQNIIPCLNCTNECSVRLEVIHPDTFEVFSNSIKELKRFCSYNDYPNYPFLFDLTSSLNKHLKLSSASSLNQSNILTGSKASDTLSNYSSSTKYNGRKRGNTHFYNVKLPSIQNFFVFCSMMAELQPMNFNSQLQEQLLLRYFCKYSESHFFSECVSHLHRYILDIYVRLRNLSIKDKVAKLQVFIINDKEVDGMFAPGVLILHEETVKQLSTDAKCFYLVARALLGMVRMTNHKNSVTISEILSLNQAVFNHFEDLRNYMHIQNLHYTHIRSLINDSNLKDYLNKNQSHFLQYYGKELRYILKENVGDRISFELSNILTSLTHEDPQQFWENLISNYNFLSPLIIDPIVGLALKKARLPTEQNLLEQLRNCLDTSKYVLDFYSDKEISDNLPRFIEYETRGLEQRLPKLKVMQKFKDFITEKYLNYLPGKSNAAQAEAFYNQFKKFNERKNFHHLQTLKNEVQRVCCFGQGFIRPERIAIECSLPGWKLLKRLKLYPADLQLFNFLKVIDYIQQV